MTTGKKKSVWFSADQWARFEIVYKRAWTESRGRTNESEIIKELMGYPLKPDQAPLVDEEMRLIISGVRDTLMEEKDVRRTPRIIKASNGQLIGRRKPND